MREDAPIPRMLGRYHVLDALERDRWGTVHLARMEGPAGFQRWATLRRVDAKLAKDVAFVDSFFDAARTAVRIQHPNVVTTLDVGETEGILWLAEEHLFGETTEQLLEAVRRLRIPVPWDIACRIVADAALGLDALHELRDKRGQPMGLMHGAVSARHVVVTYDGKTKITDCVRPAALGVPARANDPRVLAYAAPEALFGDAVDARADQFGLGVILWELSAGRSLFRGRDADETRALLEAHSVPPLREIVRSYPAVVEEIVHRALARRPGGRFPNARGLARALSAALVKEALVVTDDDVGRYLVSLFEQRFREKEAKLQSASDVTEVFRRGDMQLPPKPGTSDSTLRDVEGEATTAENLVMSSVGGAPSAGAEFSESGETKVLVRPDDEDDGEPSTEGETHVLTPDQYAMPADAPAPAPAPAPGQRVPTTTKRSSPDPIVKAHVHAPAVVPPAPEREAEIHAAIDARAMPAEPRAEVVAGKKGSTAPLAIGPAPVARPVPQPAPVMAPPPGGPPLAQTVVQPVAPRVQHHAAQPAMAMAPGYGMAPQMQVPPAASHATAPLVHAQLAAASRMPPPAGAFPMNPQPLPMPPPLRVSALETLQTRPRNDGMRPVLIAALALSLIAVVGIIFIRLRGHPEAVPHADTVPPTPSATAVATDTSAPTATAPPATTSQPLGLVGAGGASPSTATTTATTAAVATAAPPTATTPPAPRPTVARRPPPSPPANAGGGTSTSAARPEKPEKPDDDRDQPAPAAASGGGRGLLTVVCMPACDEVIDGRTSLGPSPIFKRSVSAGSHHLTLKSSDPPAEKSIDVVVKEDDVTVVRQPLN